MTEEDEKLLLKDLSARVPYGIMVEQSLYTLVDKEQWLKSVQANNVVQLYWYKYINEFVPIHCIKPYLRPLSSMTEEEEREYNEALTPLGDFMFEQEEQFKPIQLYKNIPFELYEFFNSHHFDYRGLIEKGLALEAPEGMYNSHE